MQTKNVPMMKVSTMRKDLYLVLSLLLADDKIAEAKNLSDWTEDFYEDEVRRLMLLTAVAMRGLLDLLGEEGSVFGDRLCGEYWDDFYSGRKTSLTFRQACNSSIHAQEMLAYRTMQRESRGDIKRVYDDRITVRGIHKNKPTRAHIDIMQFVQTADALIRFIQEERPWQLPKTPISTTSS